MGSSFEWRSEEHVIIGQNLEGRSSGEAFHFRSRRCRALRGQAWVQFVDLGTAEEAKRVKDRQVMGGRWLELFSCSLEDVNRPGARPLARPAVPAAAQVPFLAPTLNLTGLGIEQPAYLRLRGLPFSSTADDVALFFEGYGVSKEQVTMGVESSGRASGEAWVQFQSEAQRRKALEG